MRPPLPSVPSSQGRFRYVPYYCEENVWQLAQATEIAGRPGRRDVIFISNEHRACALWEQRAAPKEGLPVLWDYHVVLLTEGEVWDLDTTLGLPHPARDYLRRTFRADASPEVLPRFRILPADVYVQRLASDRSHMRDAAGGYLVEPPPWPVIGPEGVTSNLDRFIDMTRPFLGEVVSLKALEARLG